MKGKHRQSDNRRQQIIRAGLQCFTTKGFTETTMAEICKTANASTGSVYHHYKSKDQLAAAVYLEGIRDFQEGLLVFLKSSTTASEGIKGAVSFYIHWVIDNPDWATFLFYQRHADFMQKPNDDLHQINVTFIKTISEWFNGHAQRGDLKQLTWDIFMPLLLGPSQDYAKYYLAGLPVSPVDTAVEAFGDAAWKSLKN